jgi:hypothetical protein
MKLSEFMGVPKAFADEAERCLQGFREAVDVETEGAFWLALCTMHQAARNLGAQEAQEWLELKLDAVEINLNDIGGELG